MTRDIKQCVPELRDAFEVVKKHVLAKFGIVIKVCDTDRTETEQAVFFLNDKIPIDLVNNIRKVLGMQPETKRMITKTLCSKHVVSKHQPLSRALDFYIEKDGKPDWSDIEAYKKVGFEFERRGFNCLDEIHDYGHVEIK